MNLQIDEQFSKGLSLHKNRGGERLLFISALSLLKDREFKRTRDYELRTFSSSNNKIYNKSYQLKVQRVRSSV